MISVIIPAYNEEKIIINTLKKIDNYLKKKKYIYEIIVVDDASKDGTFQLIEKLRTKNNKIKILKNKTNKGKGYSVKRGVLNAKFDLVLFSDSDLATPVEMLERMLKYTKDYDIIIASRNLRDSIIKVKQPWYRVLAGKIFPLLVRMIVLKGIKDTQCGFKMFKKSAVKNIFPLQTFERWCFDVEILFIAKKLGFKIKEVPVVWVDRRESKMNLIRDSFKMLMDLFRIRYNNMTGKYKKL